MTPSNTPENSAHPLVFDPSLQTLQRLATLVQGAPWDKAEAAMADFNAQGFSAPQSHPKGPAEFTQSLLMAGTEVAMLYVSNDDKGLIFSCGLSWSVSEGILAPQMTSVVDALMARMSAALGPATAMMLQTEGWRQSGCEPDAVVFSCFWAQPMETEKTQDSTGSSSCAQATRTHDSAQAYRDDLRGHGRALTLSVTVSKDSPGATSTWSALALVCV